METLEIYRKITINFTGDFTEQGIRNIAQNQIYPALRARVDAKVAEFPTRITDVVYGGKTKVMRPDGVEWILYPKMSMQITTDFTEDQVEGEIDKIVLGMRTDIRSIAESNGATITKVRYQRSGATIEES